MAINATLFRAILLKTATSLKRSASRADQPAATIVDEVYGAVRRFTGDRAWHDDATLVIVRMVENEQEVAVTADA